MPTTEPSVSNYVSESQHWYAADGTPQYTIIGANGKERPTTLRDARKHGFKPSVTMICGEAPAPGLVNWKIDQNILAALTIPRIENEPEKEFITRVKLDAKEQAKKAAERGKGIHTWIQQGFEGVQLSGEAEIYYWIAYNEIYKHCGDINWQCEKPFACDRFGGKVDLHFNGFLSRYNRIDLPDYVIDIKTKDTPLDDAKTYDNHDMQLAAYRHGLKLHEARCGILFISTVATEGKLIWIPEPMLQRGLRMFTAMVDFWYAKTGLR